MTRPELLSASIQTEKSLGKETEKKPRDREWWWNWLIDYQRNLTINALEDRLAVVNDPQEFSLLLTNDNMAKVLLHTEVAKYNAQITEINNSREFSYELISIETPYSEWPNFVQEDVLIRLGAQPYVQEIKKKNWSFSQLANVYITTIARERHGFESRYWMPRLESKDEIIERSIAIGAYLLKHLLDKLGWGDTIDTLMVTSAVLPADLSIQIVEFARSKGILANRPKIELRDFRLACSSPSVALVHAATDPSINENEKTVLLALEVFGDVMGLEQYKDMLSFDTDIGPQFGNGFSAFGFDASRMQLEGARGIFTPDDTKYVRYYEVKPNNRKLHDRLLPWISDETGLIKAFSLGNRIRLPRDKRHIAYVIDNEKPDANLPIEVGAKFPYPRVIATMFPAILENVKKQFVDSNRSQEALKNSIIISNTAAEGMSETLRKKINKHIPRKFTQFNFDRHKANTGSDSMVGALSQALESEFAKEDVDLEVSGERSGKDLMVIAASTGLGASVVLALITFLIHKRQDS